jgi:3-deoxy-D-manno-octulosonic-acid transferase
MWLLLDLVYLLAGVGLLPVLAWQRIVRGKKRGGWKQRFGHLPPRSSTRPAIWIHAVSLGEVNATRGLVARLREKAGDHDIVISTTTDTGYARATTVYPDLYVFRYPLDLSWIVRRVLRTIRPAAIVLIELEVWPNLIRIAADHGIPVAIVNGRITQDRSMQRFRKPVVRSLARAMSRRLAWVGAQTDAYAACFRELGVPADRVSTMGTLKWDTAQLTDHIDGQQALATAVGIDANRPLWVAGQTGPGEETIVLDAFHHLRQDNRDLQLAIIPRKPERFDEVARQIEAANWSMARRSRQPDGAAAPPQTPDVILGDTIGELRKFYAHADVAFVGRSLVPMGGSDMIEAAALAKPIIVGPYNDNFADVVDRFAAANAICILTRCDDDTPHAVAERLASAVDDALRNGESRGQAARRVVQEHQGVTDRTVKKLIELLHHAQHRTT